MYKREYRYMKEILECGSFTGASKKLFVSQSALSQSVSRIETRLGIEIFDRNISPLKLTEAGKIFYSSLENIIAIENDTITQIEDLNNLKRGEVIVGATDYLSYYLLSNVLTKFNKQYPGIDIVLLENRTTELNESVIDGRCDFSITYMTQNKTELASISLYKEEIFVALPKTSDIVKSLNISYPQNRNFPTIDISNLKNEKIISSKNGQNLKLLFSQLDIYTDYTLHKVLETQSMSLANKLVSEGLGITLIPQFMSYEENNLNCVYVRTNPPLDKRTVMIHHSKLRKLKKPAEILISMIEEYVNENFYENKEGLI